jgi:hypothetical protein
MPITLKVCQGVKVMCSIVNGSDNYIAMDLGSPKAIMATAHKLARIFYQMWTTRQSYHDTGASYYDQQYQHRKLKQLQKQAVALGFDLIERPPSPPPVEDVS